MITNNTVLNGESSRAASTEPAKVGGLGVPGRLGLAFSLLVLAMALFLRFYQVGSLPEGVYWDEAFNGVDALNLLDGQRPIFFEGNNGREPLFIYLQAISIFFFGPTPFALRIVSAMVGLATLVAEFFLVRRLFDKNTAVIATLGLAVSFWHVSESRIGLRAILVPLMATLVFYCLWRGLSPSGAKRTSTGYRNTLWFAIAGMLLGLSLYTYLSARFIPVVVVAFLFLLLVCNRRLFSQHLGNFVTLFICSLIVFAPLGMYFFQEPDLFFGRANRVLLTDINGGEYNAAGAVVQGFIQAVGAFLVRGDIEWRHNIPNRPAMDLLTGIMLFIGLAVSLRKFRKPENGLLFLWFSIMLLPSAITIDSPHYLRAMGVLPAAYALVGVGAVATFKRLKSATVFRNNRVFGALVGLTGVLWLWLGPYTTWNDYFNIWANHPKTLEHFEAGMSEAITYLDTLPRTSRMLVSADTFPHPDSQFLTRSLPELIWFDGYNGLPLAQSVTLDSSRGLTVVPGPVLEDTYYTFPGPAERPLQLLKKVYPEGEIVADRVSRTGYGLFTAFLIPAGTKSDRFSIPQLLRAKIGKSVELLGFDAEDPKLNGSRVQVNSGEKLQVAVYWRTLSQGDRDDYIMFLHLVDANGRGWEQSDGKGYPSLAWRNGDFSVSWFSIIVPAAAPTGKYTLKVGMYEYSTLARVKITDMAGKPWGDAIDLLDVKVTGNASRPGEIAQDTRHLLGGKISLIGFGGGKDGESALDKLLLAPGDIMSIRLAYRAESQMTEDYTAFLQVLDAGGRVVAQSDSQPRGGEFPTSFWEKGETVEDGREIALPANLASGQYNLITGIYLLSTGERLRLEDGRDSISLGMVTIR